MYIVATMCTIWCFVVAGALSFVAYQDLQDKYSNPQGRFILSGLAALGWIFAILVLWIAVNV